MMRRTIGRSKLASHGQVLVVEGHENRAVFIQVESNQAVSMEEDKHTLGSENGSWDQQDFKTWGDRCNKHWMSSNKSKGLRSQWSMGLLYIPIFSVYIWRYIHYINYTSTKYLLYIYKTCIFWRNRAALGGPSWRSTSECHLWPLGAQSYVGHSSTLSWIFLRSKVM